jgi:hypothetical protein
MTATNYCGDQTRRPITGKYLHVDFFLAILSQYAIKLQPTCTNFAFAEAKACLDFSN